MLDDSKPVLLLTEESVCSPVPRCAAELVCVDIASDLVGFHELLKRRRCLVQDGDALPVEQLIKLSWRAADHVRNHN